MKVVHEGTLRARLSMSMRAWLCVLFTACGAALVVACITQEDPPYGVPGAIGKAEFRGGSSTGGTSSGDGGSSGGSNDPFPAPYSETTPPAPGPLKDLHPTVANGAQVGPQISCLSCHGPAGVSTKKWAYAGFAAVSQGSTTGLDKGEVIVYGGGGPTMGPVKTTPDGYFWIEAEAGTIAQNANTAIRDKTGKVSKMIQGLAANGDCATATQCHGFNGVGGGIDFK